MLYSICVLAATTASSCPAFRAKLQLDEQYYMKTTTRQLRKNQNSSE
jgi:hypothetical protein